MDENPYQASASAEPRLVPAESGPSVRRPIGITLLSLLHVLGGVGLLATQAFLVKAMSGGESPLDELGIPPIAVIFGVLLLAVLGLASGIGMWLGVTWGWWLATLYYVDAIFRNIGALVVVATLSDSITAASDVAAPYVVKHIGRGIVSVLLLLYLFRHNVRAYFGMQYVNKLKAVGIVIAVAFALRVLAGSVQFLAG